MKISLDENLKKDIFAVLLYCFIFSIPFSANLNSLFLILISTSFLTFHLSNLSLKDFVVKCSLIFYISILITSISNSVCNIDTFNLHYILRKLEISYSFLILPFVLKTAFSKKVNFKRLLIFFGFSLVLLIAISLIINAFWYLDLGSLSIRNKHNPIFLFTYESLLYASGIHPTYFSFLICCFFLMGKNYFHVKSSHLSIYYFIALIFVLFLGSKVGLISIIITGVFLFYKTIRKKNAILLIAFTLIISLILININPSLKYRYKTILKFPDDISDTRTTSWSTVSLRVMIWKSTINLIKERPFLGYGKESQVYLIEEYKRINFQKGINSNYGPHNTFLSMWLEYGIFPLLILLSLLMFLFFDSLKKKNSALAFFILLFIITALTESVLSRQKGVITFNFFLSLLYFNFNNDKNSILSFKL